MDNATRKVTVKLYPNVSKQLTMWEEDRDSFVDPESVCVMEEVVEDGKHYARDIYSIACDLLLEGRYEWSIENEDGEDMFCMSCYKEHCWGRLVKEDRLGWLNYSSCVDGLWDRLDEDKAKGNVVTANF